MKRGLAFLLIVAGWAMCARAQGVRYDNVAYGIHGTPFGPATIEVWNGTGTGAATVTAGTAGASETGLTVTITTTAAHGYGVGQTVAVAGVANATNGAFYNGIWTITAVPSSMTFQYVATTSGLQPAGYGITATAVSLVYQDKLLSDSLVNPFTSDGLGNYGFWAAPGLYIVGVYGPQITTKTIPVDLFCDPTASSSSPACGGPNNGGSAQGALVAAPAQDFLAGTGNTDVTAGGPAGTNGQNLVTVPVKTLAQGATSEAAYTAYGPSVADMGPLTPGGTPIGMVEQGDCHVLQTVNGTVSCSITLPNPTGTIAGDAILVMGCANAQVGCQGAGYPTYSDANGDTFAQAGSSATFYVLNVASGMKTVTCTFHTSGLQYGQAACVAMEFSNVGAIDAGSLCATGCGASSTAFQQVSQTITTNFANEVIAGFAAEGNDWPCLGTNVGFGPGFLPGAGRLYNDDISSPLTSASGIYLTAGVMGAATAGTYTLTMYVSGISGGAGCPSSTTAAEWISLVALKPAPGATPNHFKIPRLRALGDFLAGTGAGYNNGQGGTGSTTGITGGTSYSVIESAGTGLFPRSIVNFAAGFGCADDSANKATDCGLSAAANSWLGNATGSAGPITANTAALPASLIPNPAGDVAGSYVATTVTGIHFGATGIATGTAPTSGQCLEYNGTNITGAACSGGAPPTAAPGSVSQTAIQAKGTSGGVAQWNICSAFTTQTTSFTCAFTTNVSAGDTLVAFYSSPQTIAGTATDTLGNSYTLASGENSDDEMFYSVNIASGGADTITINWGTGNQDSTLEIYVVELSGVSAFDANSYLHASSIPQSFSVTTAAANEIVIGFTNLRFNTVVACAGPAVGYVLNPGIWGKIDEECLNSGTYFSALWSGPATAAATYSASIMSDYNAANVALLGGAFSAFKTSGSPVVATAKLGPLTPQTLPTGINLLQDAFVHRVYPTTGTALASSAFALSSSPSWGTSPSIAVNRGYDESFTITITAGTGTPGADPTVTLTFLQNWGTTPTFVCAMNGGTAALAFVPVTSASASAMTITYEGTPGASQTVVIGCVGMGN